MLLNLRFYLGSETILFTTDGDGAGYLKCGITKDAYATVDFGPGDCSMLAPAWTFTRPNFAYSIVDVDCSWSVTLEPSSYASPLSAYFIAD